jgi:cullin 3
LTLAKHGDLIYDGVGNSIRTHLRANIETNVSQVPNERLMDAGTNNTSTISAALVLNALLVCELVSTLWNDHKISSMKIRDVLLFVDRNYVMQQKKLPIYSLALDIFKTELLYSSENNVSRNQQNAPSSVGDAHNSIRSRLQSVLLESVEDERNGLLIDRSTMTALALQLAEEHLPGLFTYLSAYPQTQTSGTNHFTNQVHTGSSGMGDKVYETEFETPFLEATKCYYRNESQNFLSQNTCPEFVRKAESRIAEETQRCRYAGVY